MNTFSIDRRQAIRTAILGLAGMSLQAFGAVLAQRGFTHGIASGEPAAKSVLLWTRHVSDGDSLLRVEVARDAAFRSLVAGTTAIALAERDHTARVTVTGLAPDRWYFYRFIDSNGAISPIGRTRTLPLGTTKRFGVGVFSCSNLPFGHFNAYAHACDRQDLDLILHLGDYLYEYRAGSYPDASLTLPGRDIQPSHEIVTLADYRLRHANYRSDPDLQRLHSLYPLIAQWDDHELTNDAWVDGAENHQPETEGDWQMRKATAMRAYHDWMPVSDANQAVYQIGTLASLIKVETRITGRSGPIDLPLPPYADGDIAPALRRFRDDVWQDPNRSLMGKTQEQWLHDQLLASVRGGNRWQLLAQQVVVGELRMPELNDAWLPAALPARTRGYLQLGAAAAQQGLPFGFDRWDGFPAARTRLLQSAQQTDSNLVVLSGDSHNAWGYDLAVDGKPAAVEFAGHSVTSPGYEGVSGPDRTDAFAAAARQANPSLKYCDTHRRGYMSLQLSSETVSGSWHFMQTIAERNPTVSQSHTMQVQRGRRVLQNT
jgi:alkaline phosphatase D